MEWKKVRCERKPKRDRNGKVYNGLYWYVYTIERHQALEFIDEQGLVEVFHNEDGEIYDTPNQSFKDLNMTKQEKKHMIDNPW